MSDITCADDFIFLNQVPHLKKGYKFILARVVFEELKVLKDISHLLLIWQATWSWWDHKTFQSNFLYNKGLQGVKLFGEGGYRDGTLAWNGSKEIRQDQINSFMAEVPIIYRNQSIDLQSKSMGWFLYDRDLRHERVNGGERLVCIVIYVLIFQSVKWVLFVWPYASFWFSCIVTSIFVYFLNFDALRSFDFEASKWVE